MRLRALLPVCALAFLACQEATHPILGGLPDAPALQVADPEGDVPLPAGDVVAVDAGFDGTNLTISLTFASSPTPQFLVIAMAIDADQDVSTQNFDPGFRCGLGPEFQLVYFSSNLISTGFDIFSTTGPNRTPVFSGAAVLSGNALIFVIPLSALGGDDGLVNFVVEVLSAGDAPELDVVPDNLFSPDCGFLTSRAGVAPEVVVAVLIAAVQDLVESGALDSGNATALLATLDNTLQAVANGRPSAPKLLNAFINQVEGFIAGGILTPAEGQPLIDTAQSGITRLNG